ncbi:amidase signature domain-containing protein [Triangularia verruculosa]|uniref:Amidase signature domain-containing protein n=1 Tax=Triangularia verruculosa TaxID=2587418 RepID=A0AAN7APR4_9PEZI|nr:amidase signature domain-containing protein [Triangularia verruculosa]
MTTIKTNTVVDLAGIQYILGNRAEWTLPVGCDIGPNIAPAVAFSARNLHWTADGLKSVFSTFTQADDVFQSAFTEGGFLIARSDDLVDRTPTLHDSLTRLLNETSSTLMFGTAQEKGLPNGPYFVKGNSLYRAWRLYPDENLAFTLALSPSSEDSEEPRYFTSSSFFRASDSSLTRDGWEPLRAGAYSGLYPVVAVPSRLHHPVSEGKPLSGLRVTVKDNYHLNGVHTTLGSRSFAALYGPQSETSELVKRLLDKGTGSIRMPAASYGLWGLRATHSRFSMTGIMPSVPPFDTLGVLARSPINIRKIIDFGSIPTPDSAPASNPAVFTSSAQRPRKVVVPTDWFPMRNPGQQKMVDDFLDVLETQLGLEVWRVSLEDEWSRSGPRELRSITLQKYLDMSIYWPNYYDGFHTYDRFRDDFQQKFGHPPYVSPFMTRRWGLASNITKEQRDQGLAELNVCYQWVRDSILKPEAEYNFVLLPLGRPGANYRDIVPTAGGEFSESAYDPVDFCTVLGLPQIVIPS